MFEGMLSPMHLLVILTVGLLLFGNRLPEIGRSLGKGMREFKNGWKGLEDDVEATSWRPEPPALEQPRPPLRVPMTTPKWEEKAEAVPAPPEG